jgi:4-amino-4-deoxy-L-arabinose transferase-like glycosyltransferase
VVNLGRCRNKAVHAAEGLSRGVGSSDQAAPGIRNRSVDHQYPTGKALREIQLQPNLQPSSAATIGEAFDTVAQLRQGHDAQIHAVLVHHGEPIHQPGVWQWLSPLGYPVRSGGPILRVTRRFAVTFLADMRAEATPRLSLAGRARALARSETGLPRLLIALLVAGAGGYIALFVVSALLRLGYPYPLEPTEPASLIEVGRILHGQPLYVAPMLDYVPLVYGPIYFYLSALVASLTGLTYLPLRLVSLLASAGSIALAFLLVQRETGSRGAGLVAGGLLAASNPLSETAMDLGRVDALFTFLLVAAVYVARIGTLQTGLVRPYLLGGSGVLMGLAAFTKLPEAAAPIAVGILIGLILTVRARAIPFVLGACLSAALVLVLLRVQTGPWATWYLWDLPRQHTLGRALIGRFWFTDILPRFFVAIVLGPVFLLGQGVRGDRRPALFYAPALASIIAVGWASRSGGGGAQNVLLPAFATIAIMLGLGLYEGLRQFAGTSIRARTFQGYLVGLGLIQLALLIYDPRVTVPYGADRMADEKLAAAIAALPGPVWAPNFGGYTTSAQGQQPLLGAVDELTGGFGGGITAEGQQWQANLSQALQERRFRYVLLETHDCCLTDTLKASGYISRGALIPESDDFYAFKAARTPEAQLYVAPDS